MFARARRSGQLGKMEIRSLTRSFSLLLLIIIIFLLLLLFFDKVLIKYAVHHFHRDRLQQTFEGIRFLEFGNSYLLVEPILLHRQRLAPNGLVLIVRGTSDNILNDAFPDAVKMIKEEEKRLLPSTKITKLLEQAGFKEVGLQEHGLPLQWSKEEWFEGFRRRDTSAFSLLSDEQVEEAVREVDAKNPGDTISFTFTSDYITAKI